MSLNSNKGRIQMLRWHQQNSISPPFLLLSSLFPVVSFVSFFPNPLLLLWYILHIIKCYHYNTTKVWLSLSSGKLSYCSDLWKKMQATLYYTSLAFSGRWENVSFLWFQQRSMEHSLWFDRQVYPPTDSYNETLLPSNVMVSGSGAFRRWLGL